MARSGLDELLVQTDNSGRHFPFTSLSTVHVYNAVAPSPFDVHCDNQTIPCTGCHKAKLISKSVRTLICKTLLLQPKQETPYRKTFKFNVFAAISSYPRDTIGPLFHACFQNFPSKRLLVYSTSAISCLGMLKIVNILLLFHYANLSFSRTSGILPCFLSIFYLLNFQSVSPYCLHFFSVSCPVD